MNRLVLLFAPLATLTLVSQVHAEDTLVCPATPAPVTCQLYGDRLAVRGDAGNVALYGRWTRTGVDGQYKTTAPFELRGGGVTLPVPAVGQVTVTCSPYFAVSGELPQMPMIGSIIEGTSVTTATPSVHMGMARGDQIGDVGAPVDACRTYIYFAATTGMSASFGDASVGIDGEGAKLLVDLFDPAFIIEAAGDALSNATAGFVQRAGLGISMHRRLAWQSALDLPTGFGADAGEAPYTINGHVWSTGRYGIIPVPDSPVQLYVDGDTIVDLGRWPGVATEVMSALAAGTLTDLHQLVDDEVAGATPASVLSKIQVGGNLKSLALGIGPLSIDMASASFVVEHGKLHFAAEAWSPNSKMKKGQTGMPLLDAAMKAILIKSQAGVSGFADKNGYHFELEGSFQVGPLPIDNGTLVVDSKDGVTMKRPDLKFDPVAFLDQLRGLFNCDFSGSTGTCTAAGFKVLGFDASIVNGNPKMNVQVDLLGVASGAFKLTTAPTGYKFVLEVGAASLGGFSLMNAKVVITPGAVSIKGTSGSIGSSFDLAGALKVQGGAVRFNVSAQAKVGVAGFPQVDAKAVLSNMGADGAVHFTLDASFDPGQYNSAMSVGAAVAFHGEVNSNGKYDLRANAKLEIAGYKLGTAQMILSNKPASEGFTLKGRFDAEVVHVNLQGRYRYNEGEVILTGVSDLTVQSYTLAGAGFTLSSRTGLAAVGTLKLGALNLEMRGLVSPAGAVALSAATHIDIPVLAGLDTLVKTTTCIEKTVEKVGTCGTETVQQAAEWVTSELYCGGRTVESAWQCGTQMVAQAWGYVQDVVQCGLETTECGPRIVTDAALCGVDIMKDKVPAFGECARDMLACTFGNLGGAYCDPATYVPESCKEFTTPRSCWIDVACQPATCWGVTEWREEPQMCNTSTWEVNSCWHTPAPIEVPKACTEIQNVCTDIFSHVFQPDQALGYFNGTMTVTLGSVLGMSVSGNYCDLQGTCSGFGLGGSIDLTTGSPRACVDLPQSLLPAEAVLSAFAPNGNPKFCTPL